MPVVMRRQLSSVELSYCSVESIAQGEGFTQTVLAYSYLNSVVLPFCNVYVEVLCCISFSKLWCDIYSILQPPH